MALKLDDTTELQVPLKVLAGTIFVIVSASFYVFSMDERLDFLEMDSVTMKNQFQSHSEHENDEIILEIELLKLEFEYLKEKMEELRNDK